MEENWNTDYSRASVQTQSQHSFGEIRLTYTCHTNLISPFLSQVKGCKRIYSYSQYWWLSTHDYIGWSTLYVVVNIVNASHSISTIHIDLIHSNYNQCIMYSQFGAREIFAEIVATLSHLFEKCQETFGWWNIFNSVYIFCAMGGNMLETSLTLLNTHNIYLYRRIRFK